MEPSVRYSSRAMQNGISPASASTSSRAPTIGILTRTLVRSSVVKLILPARIRHKDKNDVIFVQDNSIDIKEFLAHEDRLKDVTWKGDFGGTIACAKAMGASRKAVPRAVPAGIDAIIRPHDKDSPEPMETDEVRSREIPPQILVLLLQSDSADTLVFLFATQEQSTSVEFLCYRRPIPVPQSISMEGSTFNRTDQMAIDPKWESTSSL